MALEFTFDPRTQRYRYRDSGRFVSEAAVRCGSQRECFAHPEIYQPSHSRSINDCGTPGEREKSASKPGKNLLQPH